MEENNTLPTTPAEASAHDDFDWSIDKRNVARYSNEEKNKYDSVYEGTFKTITDGEMIEGVVVGLTKTDVVLNIGFKSDGLISLNEFRDMPGLQQGDVVEVLVVEKEDREGHLHLSRKQARINRAWERIVEVHKTGDVVTGIVTSKTKGGLIVDIYGMETFLPGSQIDVKPVTDYDQFLNKTMEFKVVKINEAIKNAVVSHKALIESDLEAQRMEIMGKLEKGQVLEGTIKNLTDFGAFLDLGGVDGLLYITDISWGRIKHPSEVLKLDQKLHVVVLDFDDEKRRISLGLKQLTPHPWETLPETVQEGSVVKGRVVNIEDYGAFLEVEAGIGGMIHISDLSWLKRFNNPSEYTRIGNQIDIVILNIDKANRKLQLGHKQLEEDPWNMLQDTFAIGSIHEGTVTRKEEKGAIVQLPYGLEGFAPNRHLAKEDGKNIVADETNQFMVIEFDRNEKRIVLSHARIWEKTKTDAKDAERKEKSADAAKTSKAVKDVQGKVEKSTFGDLGVLAELKKKMEGGETGEEK